MTWPGDGAAELGGQHVFLVAFGQQVGADPPRQRGPADEAQYDRYVEKPRLGRHFRWHEGRHGHEKRDGGHRSDRVGDHLYHPVDPAAVIAADPADDQRQNKGDEHTRWCPPPARCPDRVQRARKDVLAVCRRCRRGGSCPRRRRKGACPSGSGRKTACRDRPRRRTARSGVVFVDRPSPSGNWSAIERSRLTAWMKGRAEHPVGVAELRDLRRAVGVVLVAARDGGIVGRQEGREDARSGSARQMMTAATIAARCFLNRAQISWPCEAVK